MPENGPSAMTFPSSRPPASQAGEENVTTDGRAGARTSLEACTRRRIVLGPTESAVIALLIVIPLFLIIKRSTITYSPASTPRRWQFWR
jgi:hypothetical protein